MARPKKIIYVEKEHLFSRSIWPWLIGFLSLALYFNTVFLGYNMDDEMVTRGHPRTSMGFDGITEIITSPYYADDAGNRYEYRPLTHLSFAIEHGLFGEKPWISHLINVLLYSGCCILLFFLIRALLPRSDYWLPVLATLLFVIHPLHTEVVASIKNREELLSFFFTFSAFLLIIRAFDKKRILLYGIAGITLFAFGLLSKMSGAAFAVIIPATLLILKRGKFPTILIFSSLLALPLVLLINTANLSQKFELFALLGFASPLFFYSIVHWDVLVSGISKFIKRISALLISIQERADSISSWILLRLNSFKSISRSLFKSGYQFDSKNTHLPWDLNLAYPINTLLLISSILLLWPGVFDISNGSHYFQIALFLSLLAFSLSGYRMAGVNLFLFFCISAFICTAYNFTEEAVSLLSFAAFLLLFFMDSISILIRGVSTILIATVVLIVYPELWYGLIFTPIMIFLYKKWIHRVVSLAFPLLIIILNLMDFSDWWKLGIQTLIFLGLLMAWSNKLRAWIGVYVLTVCVLVFSVELAGKKYILNNYLVKKHIENLGEVNDNIPGNMIAPDTNSQDNLHASLFAYSISNAIVKTIKPVENKITLAQDIKVVNTQSTDNLVQENDFWNIAPASQREIDFSENPIFFEKDRGRRIGSAALVTGYYLRILIMPYPLRFYYGYDMVPIVNWTDWRSLLTILLILAGGIYCLFHIKKRPEFFIAFIMLILPLLTISNWYTPIAGVIGERLIFTGSAGFSIIIALILGNLFKIPGQDWHNIQGIKGKFRFLLPVIMIICSAHTIHRNSLWKDPLTLFQHDIKYLDRSAKAHNIMASHLATEAKGTRDPQKSKALFEKANVEFQECIDVYPKFPFAWYDKALVNLSIGDLVEAKSDLLESVKIDTGYPMPSHYLAALYDEEGNINLAEKYYRLSIEIDETYLPNYFNLSYLYFRNQEFNSAIQVNEQALKLFPGNYDLLLNQGKTYYRTGAMSQALTCFKTAWELRPGDPNLEARILELESAGF